ncbi:MAG TPA: DUF255 domain-containing protein, partial [Methanothrix sp.]|nr:DUF255 domain-containing protein [Methanothrix sp.]
MRVKRKNRLAFEKSPYLLEHANNPVDWHPWGEEAFSRAERENKPVFLSIGYSTCHWCHVMAAESFEDEEVARLLNDTFVPIKVDREERPDLDAVYMAVAQMMTGSGGWPLTVILTPDKKPFFAATYIPKESRFGRIGILDLIPRIRHLWKNERAMILASAEEMASVLRQPPEVADLKAQLEKVNAEKDAAVRDQNFERAAALRDTERELQGQIRARQEEWETRRQSVRPVLGEEEIAFIVSRWTGIPVTRLQEAETARLLRMEEELHGSVVGQEDAIKAIAKAIRRSRAGLKDPRR